MYVKGLSNNQDISADWGRSDLDIRHRFVFSPVYEIGRGVMKDSAVGSALLSNWTSQHRDFAKRLRVLSFDFRRRESRRQFRQPNRVPGTVRNQFTTPSIYVFDTRVAKSIKFGEKI